MATSTDPWNPAELIAPAEVRVRFGDLPNQTLPLEWAEQFLAIMYAEQPHMFAAILPRLYGLPERRRRRSS